MMNSRDKKVQSIHNMMSLLVSIESEPKKFIENEDIISVISSQSSLAKALLQKKKMANQFSPCL